MKVIIIEAPPYFEPQALQLGRLRHNGMLLLSLNFICFCTMHMLRINWCNKALFFWAINVIDVRILTKVHDIDKHSWLTFTYYCILTISNFLRLRCQCLRGIVEKDLEIGAREITREHHQQRFPWNPCSLQFIIVLTCENNSTRCRHAADPLPAPCGL